MSTHEPQYKGKNTDKSWATLPEELVRFVVVPCLLDIRDEVLNVIQQTYRDLLPFALSIDDADTACLGNARILAFQDGLWCSPRR